MATTRLMPLHVGEGRSISTAISDIIEYVENPDKTDGFQLVTGYQCDTRSADMEFLFSKRLYEQKTGRVRMNWQKGSPKTGTLLSLRHTSTSSISITI